MNIMNFECPHCHEMIAGNEASYGQQVKCPKCHAVMLVPQRPANAAPPMARLVEESGVALPRLPDESVLETDVFKLSPVARAFPGQIILAAIMIGLGVFVTLRGREFSWPRWVALIPLGVGLLLLLLVWIQRNSYSYRLTNQRLFVRKGWLAKNVNELELYRVEDVQVDQGVVQRLLGYGTINVLSADDTNAKLELVGISSPIAVKEKIRTQYRAARKREGVRPTEFMQSPDPTLARVAAGGALAPAAPRKG